MNTQNSALRLERRHLVSVPPTSGVNVVEISTAPSVRHRREALLMEDPAMHRRPCTSQLEGERDGASGAPFSLASVVRFTLGLTATLTLGVAGVGIGMLLSPGVYSGPAAVYGIVVGESIWSIAQGVNTDRPLEGVITDIRALNNVEEALVIGQQIKAPIC